MTGFENEKQFADALNEKSFDNLNDNLQKVILFLNNNKIPKKIAAFNLRSLEKADLSISLDDKEFLISLKKGSGNSVHQEHIEEFIKYLKDNFENNELVFNCLRHFVWGDKTLDGKGKIEERVSANEYKKNHPEKILLIQNYFDKYKVELVERFIITGKNNKKTADYLIYGTTHECNIKTKEEFKKYILNLNTKPLSLGCLTFQAWNRNINGGNKSEKKRGQIQLKWGTMSNYFLKENNRAREGNSFEKTITQILNKKEAYWNQLPFDKNFTFAVHIENFKYAKINNSKIATKADIYFVTGKIDAIILEEKEFYLTELDVEIFGLKPIEKSGLSIKLVNSEFTIVKISPSTFSKLFGNNFLAAGSSIYSKEDLYKNEDVIVGWHLEIMEFKNYFKQKLSIDGDISLEDRELMQKIKSYSNETIEAIVNLNKTISDFVFKGIGNFDEPYTAHWILKDNKIVENNPYPFVVTTGSGRSKGIYTIALKPK